MYTLKQNNTDMPLFNLNIGILFDCAVNNCIKTKWYFPAIHLCTRNINEINEGLK